MILGIETATPRASLALYDSRADEVVWKRDFTTERAHNAVIFEPILEMMNDYRDQLTGIAVGVGPGSYSGVRVGIAVANGLSLSMSLPALGRSSLEAWEVGEDSYAVISDARRQSFAVSEVLKRKLQGEPELIETGEVEAKLEEISGRGIPVYSAESAVVEAYEAVALAHPDAAKLAREVGKGNPADWSEAPLEPHYLRAPYITTPKKGRGEVTSGRIKA